MLHPKPMVVDRAINDREIGPLEHAGEVACQIFHDRGMLIGSLPIKNPSAAHMFAEASLNVVLGPAIRSQAHDLLK